MNPLPEPLRFSKPLREVRLITDASAREALLQSRAREEEAYEKGRRDAEKSLSEQLLQQRNEVLALQQGVLQSLRQTIPEVAKECENTLVALALEAAQKLVSGMPITPDLIEAAVREALERVEQSSDFTVLLHAEDLELLQRVNAPLLLTEVGGERIRFQPGREVTRGGCVVQTRFGTIDARRETKMDLLRKAVGIS